MDLFSDPAAAAAFLRPLFWLLVFAGLAVLAKFLPEKIKRILFYRLP